MATCFSILAWKIPQTEEPGGLQLERVGHSCVSARMRVCAYTHTHTHTHTHTVFWKALVAASVG